LQSYILLLIFVVIIIAGTASIGLGSDFKAPFEVLMTEFAWDEKVSDDGNIGIGSLTIDVENNSTGLYRNYEMCAQLDRNKSGKVDTFNTCSETGTLSPSKEAGSIKENLLITFNTTLTVKKFKTLSLSATSLSDLAIPAPVGGDVSFDTDVATITFENIVGSGTVNVNTVDPNNVSGIKKIDNNNQVILKVGGFDFINVSDVIEINTDALFTGSITIVIPYDPSLIPDGRSEKNLVLLRFTNDKWVEIIFTIDTINKTLTGTITGFSQFMIASQTASLPSPPRCIWRRCRSKSIYLALFA